MRTVRELAGWALFVIALSMPLVGLGLFVGGLGSVAGEGLALLGAALLVALAWPRVLLTSGRLREPLAEEVAEADGRAPVLLLHRFARSEPVVRRLLLGQPALFRELRDAWSERSLVRRFAAVGPTTPLTRPPPPAEHGPVRPAIDPAWALALDRELRRARLAVIVLDGSVANTHELERARELLGLEHTILVLPSQLAASEYAALRSRLPWLPERMAPVLRFDREERAHGFPIPYVHDAERAPLPVAPPRAWLLALVPLLAGLYAALVVPRALEGSLWLSSEDALAWGVASLVLGAALALLARRALRLVAANEAVMVLLASLPWLVPGLVMLARSDARPDVYSFAQITIGAAYAAPLLWATAIVLAGSSLVRAAADRRPAFAVFGAASVLPLVPVAQSLWDGGHEVGYLSFSLGMGAVALGLSTWAASGEPRRAHAPLPIGAAAAAVASVIAASVVVQHRAWRELLGVSGHPGGDRVVVAGALAAAEGLEPWVMLVAPALVVVIGAQFAGRASRAAIGNLAVFVPLTLLAVISASAGHQAHALVVSGYAVSGIDPLAPARGVALAPGFELPTTQSTGRSSSGADIVLDHAGVMADGELLVSLQALALRRGTPPALMRAFLAPSDGTVRVAARSDLDASTLMLVATAARRAGRRELILVARGPSGELVDVPLSLETHGLARDGVPAVLQVFPHELVLSDRWGTHLVLPHVASEDLRAGRLDEQGLHHTLSQRRQMDPSASTVTLAVRYGLRVGDVAVVAAVAGRHFPTVQLAEQ